MRRLCSIMAVVFLAAAIFIAISVSEGWIKILGLQDVARWTCLTIVTVGCSLINLILSLKKECLVDNNIKFERR